MLGWLSARTDTHLPLKSGRFETTGVSRMLMEKRHTGRVLGLMRWDSGKGGLRKYINNTVHDQGLTNII